MRLVHSGFGAGAEWDDEFDSISNGWKFERRGLRHYLQRHFGKDRRVAWGVDPDVVERTQEMFTSLLAGSSGPAEARSEP